MDNDARRQGWLVRSFSDPGIRCALVLAAVLRLLWAIWVPVVPSSDGLAYDIMALTLANENVYGPHVSAPSSHWPPGTSFLYSLLYRGFGHVYWPVEALNVGLGVLIVFAAAALALSWFGIAAARVTAVLLAVWPSLILYTTVLASELPFIALMLLALLARMTISARPVLCAVVVGVLAAAATYVRVEGLLLPVLFALSMPPTQQWRRRIAFASLAMLALLILIAPWAWRNTKFYGQPTFIVTSSGTNLWMGNNPDSDGGYMPPPVLPVLNAPDADAHLRREAIDYIARNPGLFLWNSAVKAIRLHDRETIAWHWSRLGLETVVSERTSHAVKWTAHLFWIAVLLFAVAGVLIGLRRSGWRLLLHPTTMIWLYFTAIHAVTIATQDRFHFPSNPFIAMYASIALLVLGTRMSVVFPRLRGKLPAKIR
jgi:4-amino-4-deoxy-L-arabinose transferase-like glycosyltransferase